MSVVIPDDIMDAAQLTADELKLEVAVILFKRGGITLAQASRFCGMSRVQFQKQLAARRIGLHYSADDFESDLATLDELKER
jgi:predicted HTH domain antitoxin